MRQIIEFILNLFFPKRSQPQQKEEIETPTTPVEPPPPWEPIDFTGDQLPRNPNRKWTTRKLSQIKWLVVHQAAGPGNMYQIARYHITPSPNNHLSPEGAPAIAYHYVVEKDGKVYHTNKDRYLTWHVYGRNTYSIGILVVGNFDAEGHKGTDTVTISQKISLRLLLDWLKKKYPDAEVVGHCEIALKSHPKPYCPGTELMEEVKNYRG